MQPIEFAMTWILLCFQATFSRWKCRGSTCRDSVNARPNVSWRVDLHENPRWRLPICRLDCWAKCVQITAHICWPTQSSNGGCRGPHCVSNTAKYLQIHSQWQMEFGANYRLHRMEFFLETQHRYLFLKLWNMQSYLSYCSNTWIQGRETNKIKKYLLTSFRHSCVVISCFLAIFFFFGKLGGKIQIWHWVLDHPLNWLIMTFKKKMT